MRGHLQRAAVAAAVIVGFFCGAAVRADWASDWQTTLSDLWANTKAKTKEVFDPQRYRLQGTVAIGIAYGTEKEKWLQQAVQDFANTEPGKHIKINLIPMGSVEGAQAILNQDKRIHVWSPASSLVQDLLVEPWQREHGNDPIASDAPLALTPIVIVMWKDRYNAFVQKYGEVNFKTVGQALAEPTGWAAIANKPEWGPFKFGHTSPLKSNSGLLSLVLMAYDYHGLFRGLGAEQVMDQNFLTWLGETEKYMSADEESTGKLMTSMLRFGPSEFDGVVVYENLALSNLETAKGRWGDIQVIYPTRTVWNDHPYYILDTPWSTPEQREAAEAFQDFLLSKDMQRVARDQFLFRPANVDLPILEEGSAFNRLQQLVKVNVPTIDRPKGTVLGQLMQVWKRVRS
jgi:ABC-type Fe3+ transport system substrate-binding protein